MKRRSIFTFSFLIICVFLFTQTIRKNTSNNAEKRIFQTFRSWEPTIDNRGDNAIIYNANDYYSNKKSDITFNTRINSLNKKGYITHFTTEIACRKCKK